MMRIVQFRFNDATGLLEAFVPRQTGGDDVIWSTADTATPAPWLHAPIVLDE